MVQAVSIRLQRQAATGSLRRCCVNNNSRANWPCKIDGKSSTIFFSTKEPRDATTVNSTHSMTPETLRLAEELVGDVELGYAIDSSHCWKHRAAISKAITLVESRSRQKKEQAASLLTYLLEHTQKPYFRVGIAGSPGAGKSTFIEAFGQYILGLSQNVPSPENVEDVNATQWRPERLAVVCIDPSSLRTGGSILGDKARMTVLSAEPRAFVRPAPTQGVLGGLAAHTDDVLRLLSHQYPLTLLETVGLGQSEVEVQQSVDMLILAIPPSGGDSLQAVKRGIVEVADAIVVTKADSDLLSAAKHTAADYRGAMHFLDSMRIDDGNEEAPHFPKKVLVVSSVTGGGLDKVWRHICEFRDFQMTSGQLQKRRQEQRRYWMWKHLQASVQEQTMNDPSLRNVANKLLHRLDNGLIPPRVAANVLLQNLKSYTH